MTEATIRQGAAVYSHDGSPLGEVGETRPQHFQVVDAEDTAGFGGDFWLKRSLVETTSIDRVTVGFIREELQEYRTADPGAEGVVPATSRQDAYIAGATPEEANELADPTLEPPVANPESR